MLSRFFLERPVFAWVIAIILMVAGGLAIYGLPISQYPPIAPPSIAITSFYPGASAETVENSVTQIIEQKMTGFGKMLYLSATSDSSGASRVELTFAPGTDPDLAWAQVQNKLQLAMASLPQVVQMSGVKVSKSTRNYLMIVGAMGYLFQQMPTAYLPDEDQGMVMVQAMLPANSTLEQTEAVMRQVRDHFLVDEKEAVKSCMIISGSSFAGRGQNAGMSFVMLKDWKLRQRPDLKVDAVVGRAMRRFSQIRNAIVFAMAPPAVIELGTAKGFDFQLLDRGGLGHERLMAARNQLLGMAAQDPVLTRVRPNGLEDVPQYRVDVDWDKAGAQGVPITAIHSTISAAFGSAYVNDFIQGGRVKRVYVQADAPYRMLPSDLEKLYVRNNVAKMVPFSTFAAGHWTSGSPKLERFNGFPSLNIQGEAAPGRSSGETMKAMEGFVKNLPQGIGYDWTGLSYQERQAGAQTGPLYAFSILVIFLCLAALYESWPIPIAILLTLPLGVIGGVIGSTLRGMPNDVCFQIGLLTTLGLTTKNAILIVQYAKARVEQGMGLIEATLEGAKLRMRPIIVTQYEGTIQNAFREVADALAASGTADEQVAAQQSLVHAVAETYRLARLRYDKGVDSDLSVLDAQRSLYAAQQGLVSLQLARFASEVRLYATLGGGADPPPAERSDNGA